MEKNACGVAKAAYVEPVTVLVCVIPGHLVDKIENVSDVNM